MAARVSNSNGVNFNGLTGVKLDAKVDVFQTPTE